MKKYILFLIFSALVFSVFADKIDDCKLLIKQGNDFYMKQKYDKAVENYEKVINAGYVSAELHYNLGNAYYKLNKNTLAIVNYERAKLLDPDNDRINQNLKIAQLKTIDKIESLPNFSIVSFLNQIVNLKSTDFWAYLSIVAFALGLTLIGIYLFSKKLSIRKISFWTGSLILIISIVTFFFSYEQKRHTYNQHTAVISVETVVVKSSPDDTGTDLYRLHEGTKVSIGDYSGNWREIKLSDGRDGWILKSDMIEI